MSSHSAPSCQSDQAYSSGAGEHPVLAVRTYLDVAGRQPVKVGLQPGPLLGRKTGFQPVASYQCAFPVLQDFVTFAIQQDDVAVGRPRQPARK